MSEQNIRRFPPPWRVECIEGGYVVKDANGQSLAYIYGRESGANADTAVPTIDEARRIAANAASQRAIEFLCTREGAAMVEALSRVPPKLRMELANHVAMVARAARR